MAPVDRIIPGTYGLYSIDGIVWPVVLLDLDMLPESERSPAKAHTQPVLQLCRHKIIWANTDELMEFGSFAHRPSSLYSTRPLDIDINRAFAEATACHGLEYWHGILASKRLAQSLECGGAQQLNPGKSEAMGPKVAHREFIDLTETDEQDLMDVGPEHSLVDVGPEHDLIDVNPERAPYT